MRGPAMIFFRQHSILLGGAALAKPIGKTPTVRVGGHEGRSNMAVKEPDCGVPRYSRFPRRPALAVNNALHHASMVISDHLLTKRVTIGYRNLPRVISHNVAFNLPIGERHIEAVFEAITGHMPPEFEHFYQFNPRSSEIERLATDFTDDALPLIFAVSGGTHAMGIYAPPQPRCNVTGPTYGRFRFFAEKVVKWNCVFRLSDQEGILPGDYLFRMFVLVGDLATVRASMGELHKLAALENR
jgi:hypothetical protein